MTLAAAAEVHPHIVRQQQQQQAVRSEVFIGAAPNLRWAAPRVNLDSRHSVWLQADPGAMEDCHLYCVQAGTEQIAFREQATGTNSAVFLFR